MPLSEEEQKLLEEIERQFYETDPQLANTVRSTTVSQYTGRGLALASIGLIASFVVLILGFTHHWLIGLAGFAGMVVCALALERSLRRLGRSSWWSLTGRFSGRFGEPGASPAALARRQRLAERLARRRKPE